MRWNVCPLACCATLRQTGMHDDCVMSLAMAWQGIATSAPLLLWGDDGGIGRHDDGIPMQNR